MLHPFHWTQSWGGLLLDALFLHPVFALDKIRAPINVDSFGLLSASSFDMGEMLREEDSRSRSGRCETQNFTGGHPLA